MQSWDIEQQEELKSLTRHGMRRQGLKSGRMAPYAATLLCFVLILCIGAYTLYKKLNAPPHVNSIAVGKSSELQDDQFLKLNHFEPVSFTGLSKQKILKLRQEAVGQFPELLALPYQPSAKVFGEMDDDLPWFGVHGFFYHGSGALSTSGPSYESEHLLNPFVLIAPEFWAPSIWMKPHFAWRTHAITEEILNDNAFPFTPWLSDMKWYPQQSRAEVTYDLTTFMHTANEWVMNPIAPQQFRFGLVTLNARDFGYEYLWLPPRHMKNLEFTGESEDLLKLEQRLGTTNLCGLKSDCNHHVPHKMGGDAHFIVHKLPAKVRFILWKKKPASLGIPPNISFDLLLE